MRLPKWHYAVAAAMVDRLVHHAELISLKATATASKTATSAPDHPARAPTRLDGQRCIFDRHTPTPSEAARPDARSARRYASDRRTHRGSILNRTKGSMLAGRRG
jgi:hypothetical protein